eukprot:244550_1
MDCSVSVWDTNSLEVVTDFEFDDDARAYDCAMSPIAQHQLIAAAVHDRAIRLCDMMTGACTHSLNGHTQPVWSVAWSPKNEYMLASGSIDHTIRIWDIRRPGALMVLDMHNNVDPHMKYLSSKDAKRSQHVHSHSGAVNALRFTRNGSHLLSCGTDRRIRLWDIDTGKNTLINFEKLQVVSKKTTLTLTDDDQFVFVPNGRRIQMFSMRTGNSVKTFRGHFDDVNCCDLHPLRQELYSG